MYQECGQVEMADDGIDWEDVLEDIEEEDDKFLCHQCGKRVRTEIGLRQHTNFDRCLGSIFLYDFMLGRSPWGSR